MVGGSGARQAVYPFHPLATLGGVVVSDGTGPEQEQRINTGDEPDTFPYSGRDLPYAVWVDWPTELNPTSARIILRLVVSDWLAGIWRGDWVSAW